MLLQHAHQRVAHSVVDDALALDRTTLLTVKCGGIVFIRYDQKIRILSGEYLFCFSFIQLCAFFHNLPPCFSSPASFNCNGLGKIFGFINIAAIFPGDIISKQLQRNDFDYRGKEKRASSS